MEIAVKCKDWKQTKHEFVAIMDYLRSLNQPIYRLIFHENVVGTKRCRVKFFCASELPSFEGIGVGKYDICIGFKPSEQKRILKEGCKISRKNVDPAKDHIEDIKKYFV